MRLPILPPPTSVKDPVLRRWAWVLYWVILGAGLCCVVVGMYCLFSGNILGFILWSICCAVVMVHHPDARR